MINKKLKEKEAKRNPTSAEGLKECIFNNYLKDCKEKKIVNLGCGYGRFCNELKEQGNEITLVDIHNHNPSLKYVLADLNKDFPLKSDYFDVVFSIDVIEHLENSRHFLRECRRILKKEGKIIITTPNLTHLKARLKFLLRGVLYGFDKKDYEDSGHITSVFVIDFKRMAKEIGLRILNVKGYKEIVILELTRGDKK